jgi:DNA-binding GntR family transcriptional regulator
MAKSRKAKTPRTPTSKLKRKPASKGGSLAAQAYEQIKEKILTLHFLPGQYLNEGALCAMLDAGRTPVHQALQRLELEGLAERATAEDAEELKTLARQGYGNGKPTDVDTFTIADRSFHAKFAEMAGNPVLSDFARTLHERSIRYWYLHLWQTMDTTATIRQHTAIAEMIAKHDADGAAKAVRDHIEKLRQRLVKAQNATQRGVLPRR